MMRDFGRNKMIVVRPNVAVPTAGDRLYNPATNLFVQPIGGFGIYVDTAGSGNPTAVTGASWTAGTPFKVIQRRDTSSDPAVLDPRILEESSYIHNNCTLRMQIGGEGFTAGRLSAWIVGDVAGQIGQLPIVSNSNYNLMATAHGYKKDMFYNTTTHPTTMGFWTSPDWNSHPTITTDAQRLDYSIQSMVRDMNRKSEGLGASTLCFAVSTTGGSGTALSTIAALAVDSEITIGYDRSCTPIVLRLSADRLQAIADLEAQLVETRANGGYGIAADTATLVPYVFSDNCATVPAGNVYAGTTANADMIAVLAIDYAEAPYDEIKSTRTSINVGVNIANALTTTRVQEYSFAKEIEGSSRNLRINYDNTEHYHSYSSPKKWGANHVAYTDEILEGEMYDIYTISHCHNRVGSGGNPTTSNLVTTIALVHTERAIGTSPFSTGAVNPQKTYLEGVLTALANANGIAPVTL